MRILVLGAGGHGQVVADILLRMREAGTGITVVGYLDDDPILSGQHLLGVPVVGRVADLNSVAHDGVVLAIGNNQARQRLAVAVAGEGRRFAVACHPRAVVAPGASLGPGTVVCAGAIVNPGTTVGAHAILNTGCTVDHHNTIGDFVHIAPGAHLGGGVTVGEGGLVGMGSSVLPGRAVGTWTVIGAGAVVTTDIGANATAVGIPARIL